MLLDLQRSHVSGTPQKGPCGPVGTHHQAGEPDPAQLWVDVVPDADAAASDLLTHRQLQVEEGDADEEEEDYVGHQVGT